MKTPIKIQPLDDRRNIVVPGNTEATVRFATEHWIQVGKEAIRRRGKFAVALSGGSTPSAIFTLLAADEYREQLDWSKVWLFWSDERAAPPDHKESNYHMAMESGFAKIPVPKGQIFRMEAEADDIEQKAERYEGLIRKNAGVFDLVMLGVGEDGHTASLFPNSRALGFKDKWVAANWIADKKCWRMTLTFPCIDASELAVIYALGASKQEIIGKIMGAAHSTSWPVTRIGTREKKALWILDESAAKSLLSSSTR